MIGKIFSHYKILEKLGEGGMGVVYKAKDTKLKRYVAIKFLPHHITASEEERERFKIEAQAAAALNHPNISTIHAIEEFEDEVFLVMEFIDGLELKEKIKKDEISLEEGLNIAFQIAEGLKAAHEKNIVHRDIKSANIMINKNCQVKIMDFGLAKIEENVQVTKMGMTVGTAAFMSPEQARGEEVDARTDIWSFGIVLYELLTGQLPFQGSYEQAVMYSILNEEPVSLSSLRKDVPSDLEEIVNKCLQKDANNRYQDISSVLEEIKNLGKEPEQGPVIEKEIPPVSKPGFRINHKWVTAFSVLFLMTLLVLFVIPPIWQKISGPQQQHLLVLPLKNIGDNPAKQAFCDGLVETMASKLTQLEQVHSSLWVVPASEVIRNKIQSPSEAKQIFGVNLVVSGSVQQIDKKILLTLNLIDAKNVRQISSAVIDVDESELLSLQKQSIEQLLGMLKLELQPENQNVLYAAETTVPGAYDFYLQGRGYMQRYENPDNLDTAIELFKRAIEQDSLYAQAFSSLGEAYWRKYETTKNELLIDDAKFQCEKAEQLNNELAGVNITLGLIYNGTGNYKLAVDVFKKALQTEPTNSDAFRGLAKAYEAFEKFDQAEQTYKKAIELKPDYWGGYNDLGVFYFRNSRYDDAIVQFKQVIGLTPDNQRGYNNLGGIFYLKENWLEARKMFEQALKIKKTYRVCSNLGTLYYIEGRFEDAVKMYEMALDLNSEDYLIWGNLASAYFWTEDQREESFEFYKYAIELAEDKLKINQKDPVLISNLAQYYSMIDERDKSLSLIATALELASNNARIMYHACSVYEQLGDREEAIHWIGEALKNGYSYSEIKHQPELKELTADTRFKQIAMKFEKSVE